MSPADSTSTGCSTPVFAGRRKRSRSRQRRRGSPIANRTSACCGWPPPCGSEASRADLRSPAATGTTNARDFSGGWFRMGDPFRRDPDGSYDFVDRAKCMIKSGARTSSCRNRTRAAVGFACHRRNRRAPADDHWGEVPVAFISRNDDNLTETDIESLCRKELASYKRPKAVHFIPFEDFPRSTTARSCATKMEAQLRA